MPYATYQLGLPVDLPRSQSRPPPILQPKVTASREPTPYRGLESRKSRDRERYETTDNEPKMGGCANVDWHAFPVKGFLPAANVVQYRHQKSAQETK